MKPNSDLLTMLVIVLAFIGMSASYFAGVKKASAGAPAPTPILFTVKVFAPGKDPKAAQVPVTVRSPATIDAQGNIVVDQTRAEVLK